MATTTTRQTADERRDVRPRRRDGRVRRPRAARCVDRRHCATRAGISQPYLFRLFGSKKELFLAANDACFQRALEAFREAASGKSGEDALDAIGSAYAALIETDRAMLQGQMQAYSAAVEDADVRASTARGFGRLVDYVEAVSGADKHTLAMFFAKGMLMNVLAAMQYSITDESQDSWVTRLAEGCREARS